MLSLDTEYQQHKCSAAFEPLIASDAPFLFLHNWAELEDALLRVWSDPKEADRMQLAVVRWYTRFMRDFALRLEGRLEASVAGGG